MNPVAFSIGPVEVRWYGILIASALLIAILGGSKQVRKHGIDEENFLTLIMVTIVAGFIGARIYYVLFNLPYYSANPSEIIAIWHGGIAIHGGLIGGGIAFWIMCNKYQINFWELADIMAPFIILGQAIGRWGNFFNQEAYGYEVDPNVIWWAIEIDGKYHHPTFLYESVWNVLVFGLLVYLSKQVYMKQGEIALLYLSFYSIGRVFIEGFRTDSLMFGPFRMAQIISIVLFVGAVSFIIYRRKKYGSQLPSVIEWKY